MVSGPPACMASRAFTARLSSAISSWLRSTITVPSAIGNWVVMSMALPSVRCSSSLMPTISARTSVGSAASSCRRLKASMRCVSTAPRWAACRAFEVSACSLGSAFVPFRTSSRLEMITVSRLLKSCATPPVSLPMASIFCDWKSASRACSSFLWASRRSVMSRVILAKPRTLPSEL